MAAAQSPGPTSTTTSSPDGQTSTSHSPISNVGIGGGRGGHTSGARSHPVAAELYISRKDGSVHTHAGKHAACSSQAPATPIRAATRHIDSASNSNAAMSVCDVHPAGSVMVGMEPD
eukprot:865294-Rhodomonas_salina.2